MLTNVEVVSTFFGPVATIATDIRIRPELQIKGHWEFIDLLSILRRFQLVYPNSSGTMLDIGCNVGTWMLPIAQRYPNNRVMAFDCQQLAVDCIKETIRLNYLTNVEAQCVAVADVDQMVMAPAIDYNWSANFGAYEFEPPTSSSDFNGRVWKNQKIETKMITIDSLNLTDVVFMKIDVEGMEHKVLQGSKQTILNSRPFIVLETHKTDMNSVQQLLTELDYKVYNLTSDMSMALPKEIKY